MYAHTRRLLVVIGFVLLDGCLTEESTMKADGSGTMTLTYPPPAGASKNSETKRFTSDVVTVDSIEIKPDGKQATVKLKFTDATKLSTAKALENVTVTRTKGDGTEKVAIVIKPDKVIPLKPGELADQPPLSFKMTMPGKITEANAKGTMDGSTVTWKVSTHDFVSTPSTELTLTYELPKS
jgi:hypothetical protein